ncbi:ABC transporter ATP-binding protein [Lacibacter sediminis]|uniref:ATP-binding cassette domain-containing protein n=1 Tax=Lacibacter sediminis TaxID=2760713 RepID=A0A7G5XJJ6_9BACT|nr:ABC transporter ATP-binding protein [Lacibacter sediminis]QNA45649.1 ATP-binding cassette domain-containing protein [Lacibacter sediminis]
MSTILEVQNLKKYFSSQKAVDDISFTISQGSIFGLLGPNGAGKTTLIRMITGIFYPDAGNILLNGKKFDPVNDVINIGYMPEERGLYKKMKVGEQAMYLAQLKGMSKQDAFANVKEWFEKFEMQSWWNKKVEDLSKGMGQKLQFVTTVLHEPKLVILDEPFSGLDPVNSNLIKDEIFNLAKKGTTIIFSTHRMEQVEEICDHIVLVNKGQKILDGSVKEIKQQFKQHIFTAEVDRLPATLQHPSFSIVKQNGTDLTLKINEGYQSNDILLHFINQQSMIVAYHEILPSLNEIFIRLIEGTPTARQFETVTA